MHLSPEYIIVTLLVGVVVGLLPSTIVPRKGFRLISDVTVGVIAVLCGNFLILTWRSLIPDGLLSSKPVKTVNYEPVVLPLAPLRPLLKPIIVRSRQEVCGSLADAAGHNDLPTPFFIRLLFQESGFRPEAISRSGALGMAQFMPGTAVDRKLDNPFDPLQAIPASAGLLRDLQKKFGNLGLAAAAYNAGPKRVQDWITDKRQLPQETQDYVKAITGWPIDSWTGVQVGSPALKLPRDAPCQELAGLLAWSGPDRIPLPLEDPRTDNLSNRQPVVLLSADEGSTNGSDERKVKD